MSKEIRRLHRKKTAFTNFSGSGESQYNPDRANNKRSEKRKRSNDSVEAIDDNPLMFNSTELLPQIVEDRLNDASPAESLTGASSAPISTNDVDFIRADLREDIFHSKVTDADYSDDPYDWGGNSQDISEDYWHFLASFE